MKQGARGLPLPLLVDRSSEGGNCILGRLVELGEVDADSPLPILFLDEDRIREPVGIKRLG